jgi:hypothetical protein
LEVRQKVININRYCLLQACDLAESRDPWVVGASFKGICFVLFHGLGQLKHIKQSDQRCGRDQEHGATRALTGAIKQRQALQKALCF